MRFVLWPLGAAVLVSTLGCSPRAVRAVAGVVLLADATARLVKTVGDVRDDERPPETRPPTVDRAVYLGNVYLQIEPAPLPPGSTGPLPTRYAPGEEQPFSAADARTRLAAAPTFRCGGPPGLAHAYVTFNSDGIVSKVKIDEPELLDAAIVWCVGRKLGRVTVPPFGGSAVTVGATIEL